MREYLRTKEDRRRKLLSVDGQVDYSFLILLILLLAVGLGMLYSASFAQSQYDTGYTVSTRYLQKQAACAVIGLGAMVVLSRIPVDFWYRMAWPAYGLSILLLLLVLLFGQSVNGAKRWISIAGQGRPQSRKRRWLAPHRITAVLRGAQPSLPRGAGRAASPPRA